MATGKRNTWKSKTFAMISGRRQPTMRRIERIASETIRAATWKTIPGIRYQRHSAGNSVQLLGSGGQQFILGRTLNVMSPHYCWEIEEQLYD
jgi:hypothetical protein